MNPENCLKCAWLPMCTNGIRHGSISVEKIFVESILFSVKTEFLTGLIKFYREIYQLPMPETWGDIVAIIKKEQLSKGYEQCFNRDETWIREMLERTVKGGNDDKTA